LTRGKEKKVKKERRRRGERDEIKATASATGLGEISPFGKKIFPQTFLQITRINLDSLQMQFLQIHPPIT
jgi:hypothetical protein